MNAGTQTPVPIYVLRLEPLTYRGPGRPITERVNRLIASLARFGLRCQELTLEQELRDLPAPTPRQAETAGVFSELPARRVPPNWGDDW